MSDYTRYSTNIQNEMWRAVYNMFVSNSLEYVPANNWQNWMTFDKVTTNI